MRLLLIALLFVLNFPMGSQAHNGSATEAEEIESMLMRDLFKHYERSQLLSNTILNDEVETFKKCEYIRELDITLHNFLLTIQDLEASFRAEDSVVFGSIDQEVSEQQILKRIYLEQYRSQWIAFGASIEIFKENHNCQQW